MITNSRSILSGVSWQGALFGFAVGLFTYLFLTMLGIAIGGQVFDPQAMSELGWGALIWMAISLAISGYAAGFYGSKGAPGLVTRTAGLATGALAGILILLTLTFFTYSSITTAGKAALGVVEGAASGIASLPVGQMAQRAGLPDALQNVADGVDREEIENYIAEASPELDERQVSITTDTVVTTLNQSYERIREAVTNPAQLGTVISQQTEILRNQLTGPQFTGRLTAQGLTPPEAEQVTMVVSERVNQIQNQLEQARNNIASQLGDASEAVADVASKGAWIWLLVALILVSLSTLGGASGRGDKTEAFHDDYENDDVEKPGSTRVEENHERPHHH